MSTKSRTTSRRPPRSPDWRLPEDLKEKLPDFRRALEQQFPKEAVETAIQDSLLAYWKASANHEIQNPPAYFYTIAAHKLSRSAKRRASAPVVCNSEEVDTATETLSGTELGPHEEIERQSTIKELMGRAPGKYRALLRMHFIEELPAEEIAKELDVSPSSIGKMVGRALTYCRENGA